MGFLYLNDSPDSPDQLVNPIPVSKLVNTSSAQVLSSVVSQVQSSVPTLTQSSSLALATEVATAESQIALPATVSSRATSSEPAVVKQSVVPLVQTNSMQGEMVPKPRQSSVASKKAESSAGKVAAAPEVVSVKNSATNGSYSEQEKTILSWDGADYTLQLVGLSSEKAARDFIAVQSNKKDLLLFKSKRQGKDWFVVVTGRYPSSAKARQAAQLLPEDQKKAAPWPREVKVIQKEIKQL
jgi:DamX protein